MKKTRLWILGCCVVVVVMVSAGCASLGVANKGAEYFVGKTEADLTKYIGREGVAIDMEEEHDYDSILLLPILFGMIQIHSNMFYCLEPHFL